MEDALPLREGLLSSASERRSFLLLRWVLLLATTALILASRLYQTPPLSANILLLTFAASNVILSAYWGRIMARPGAQSFLAAVDTVFICVAIVLAGVEPNEMFVISLLVLFLVAFSRSLRQIVASALAVAFLYTWMTVQLRPEGTIFNPAFAIRIPFLYSVALYFGHMVRREGIEARQSKLMQRERSEVRTLIEVLETVSSSLDLHKVLQSISTQVSRAVKVQRCSVLLVEAHDTHSVVLATSDAPDATRLELDLSRYPEVRSAVERREPVLIADVRNHPLMEGVRHHLSATDVQSILVVPMIHRDDLVGVLVLRASATEPGLTPRVIDFCLGIASASANAIKNALIYRQMREESSRHRATADLLRNILQQSMDLIVTTDLEGRISDFNRTAEQCLGYRREEVVGLPLTEIYHGSGDRPALLALLRGSGHIDDRRAWMKARDGSKHEFDLSVSVVRNDLGEIVGSVCVGKKQFAYA